MNEELFLHLAEIAGVFVGFGALISMRHSGDDDPDARAFIKAITTMGAMVIALALAPLVIAELGVAGHALWVSSAAFAAVLYTIGFIIINRGPDFGRDWSRRNRTFGKVFVSVGLPLHVVALSCVALIFLGILPGLEPGLYGALLTAALFFSVWTLLMLVWHPGAKADAQRGADEDAHSMQSHRPAGGAR